MSTRPAQDLFTADCAQSIRQLIAEFDGCEVFATGTCNADGVIESLDPVAYGTWDCVPAPAQQAKPGQVLVHNHPEGPLDPSEPDINIASIYGKAGIGFYIIDNQCRDVRVVVRPFKEDPLKPVHEDTLLKLFGPEGRMAGSMPGYEFRREQMDMMKFVARAFNGDRLAVVEAGTGTGKSFAYLAPAILWALENKKRVVLSTHTINLQEQLLRKDIPDLSRRLGWDVKAALVKGRGNFVSLRRLKFALTESAMFPDERTTALKALAQWADKTTDGSKSDLGQEVQADVWDAVVSDQDDCLRAKCPNFNECFFYKSRREAASADVVVANHHLVMADLALKQVSTGSEYTAILPPFDRVVFDEVHNLEEVATSYFSVETGVASIRRALGRLVGFRERRGTLVRLMRALVSEASKKPHPTADKIIEILQNHAVSQRAELDFAIDLHFQNLYHLLLQHLNRTTLGQQDRFEIRITDYLESTHLWIEIRETVEALVTELRVFLSPLEQAFDLFQHLPDHYEPNIVDYRTAATATLRKLVSHGQALKTFLTASSREYCRWVEISVFRDRPMVRIYVAPLDIAEGLRESLFERKKTVILASATLSVNKKFDFFAKRLGLMSSSTDATKHAAISDLNDRTDYLQLDTPFNYQENCMLGVPTDLPPPGDPGFEKRIAPFIIELVIATQGRAFVLFTSYRSLQTVFAECRSELERAGIRCLRQGETPRHLLLQEFKQSERAVLFATSSFWEGVDVQGRGLECVILTKLPFSVPSTPILEARTEAIERRGGNPFYELTIPMAVIRFKQGFGRLIRSKSDAGIIAVLDHRMITKPYGRIFLSSLPPLQVVDGSSEIVWRGLTDFHRTHCEVGE